jgi:hypothetical protein
MNNEFKIEINNWLPSGAGEPEVRETTAEISIRVGSNYATEVEDRPARSVRKSVRASAYLLATWFASNWWRLRWEPEKKSLATRSQGLDWDLSHELGASGGGYVWPPLTLSSDGYHMLVQCDGREKESDETLSPIRYLNSFATLIDVSSFENGVSNFVEQVLARLDASGIRRSLLHEAWTEVRTERTKKSLESKRKLEALLGVDPDEQEGLIEGLMKWQAKVGKQALGEIAAASETSDVETILNATADAANSVHTFSRIADYEKIKSQLADKGSLSNNVPWRLGKEAASTMRRVWKLGDKPVTNQDIAERLDVDEAMFSGAHPKIPVAVGVRGSHEEQLKLLLRSMPPARQRFDLARLIGDHIGVDAGDTWKPATRSLTARQKFQRAFAAEFLCPSDMLYARYKSGFDADEDVDETILEISREYQVSPRLVLNHLANRGLIGASPWGGSDLHAGNQIFQYS